MMTRRLAPSIFLALALLCVLPSRLYARVRTHAAQPQQHVSPRGRAPEHRSPESHRQERRARHVAVPVPAPARGRGKRARMMAAALPRTRREAFAARRPVFQPRHPVAVLPRSIVVVQDAPAAMGVSRPTELADVDEADAPPAVSVPVISVIRKTAEKPQLPSVEDAAATPAILPSMYDKGGHLVVPPAMRGSHEILLHQNEVADRDGLARVQDDSDLDWMRRRAMLVALPVSSALRVDERLPLNRRYCRPWVAQFLVAMARAYNAQFHAPLQVNSAVRTVQFQQRLLRTNGNAAPAGGETASPHLTGQAVDLAKRGLSLSQIAWIRGYLLPLVQDGKIDVEEEFQQSCFHISVYKAYAPAVPAQRIAVTHRDSPAALAIALQ